MQFLTLKTLFHWNLHRHFLKQIRILRTLPLKKYPTNILKKQVINHHRGSSPMKFRTLKTLFLRNSPHQYALRVMSLRSPSQTVDISPNRPERQTQKSDFSNPQPIQTLALATKLKNFIMVHLIISNYNSDFVYVITSIINNNHHVILLHQIFKYFQYPSNNVIRKMHPIQSKTRKLPLLSSIVTLNCCLSSVNAAWAIILVSA